MNNYDIWSFYVFGRHVTMNISKDWWDAVSNCIKHLYQTLQNRVICFKMARWQMRWGPLPSDEAHASYTQMQWSLDICLTMANKTDVLQYTVCKRKHFKLDRVKKLIYGIEGRLLRQLFTIYKLKIYIFGWQTTLFVSFPRICCV